MHILLISRHYPPECSGGARRPMLYANALRALGHRVTLVTPMQIDDDDSITVSNASIDRSMKNISTSDKRPPAPIAVLKKILRQWLFWPDPDIRWARDVVGFVQKTDIRPDWIFTTSPPESVHYIGAVLSQKLGRPWVAELRDTWVDFPHRNILENSKIRAFIERRIAKKYLSKCDAVTTVSEAVMKEARRYIAKDTPECIISHFSNKPPPPHQFDKSKLNLVHTGGFSLSDRRRKLKALLEALKLCQIERPEMVLHIAGALTSGEMQMAQQSDVPIVLHGVVSLKKSRALQAGADALILQTPNNSHALPGKYAEYAMTDRPILYLGEGDWVSLVDNDNDIKPLSTSLMDLKKGERVARNRPLTDEAAARKFVEFLSNVDLHST